MGLPGHVAPLRTCDGENLTRLYRAIAPRRVGCLGSAEPGDVPVGEFLRGGSEVWMVQSLPGAAERAVAEELIRVQADHRDCLIADLREPAEYCRNFHAAEGLNTSLCDNFCLLAGGRERCTRYVPSRRPHFLVADTTQGRAARLLTRAEELMARSRDVEQCLRLALGLCSRIAAEEGQSLPVESGALNLVSSVRVLRQLERETWGQFAGLLARRFDGAQLAGHEPLVEELKTALLRLQADGHARELYRLVNKKHGWVYVSLEVYEQPPGASGFTPTSGASVVLEALSRYFQFDRRVPSFEPEHCLAASGEGRAVMHSVLLAPRKRAERAREPAALNALG